jgi:hypothetical protein
VQVPTLEFAPHTVAFCVHSSTSVHESPSPEKPVWQVQLRLPTVFVHVAKALQPPLFDAHSSTSLQLLPSDPIAYPVLQMHVKLPCVFTQFCAQPPLFVLHSFTSWHVGFDPPDETKPLGHEHV